MKQKVSSYTSEFLLAAHDFALLSEEEADEYLSTGHLACESFDKEIYCMTYIDFLSEKVNASDLCSEFSAQCLLSSVANMIDFWNENNCLDNTTKCIDSLEKSKRCMIVATAELRTLDLLEIPNSISALCWLTLNFFISKRDDESCSMSLNKGGLYEKLRMVIENPTYGNGDTAATDIRMKDILELDNVYCLASRAQRSGMRQTAKLLLTLCANEMLRSQKGFIMNESNTLGSVQRNIIELSTTVEEIIRIFGEVDKLMKATSSGKTSPPYSEADIDYFVIESHNRACSLTFMGDVLNAEKLLVVSLNLLPLGSKEIESFGPAIRRTYRAVLGRKGVGGAFTCTSAHDLISLLEA